jgi:hypothetical protein
MFLFERKPVRAAKQKTFGSAGLGRAGASASGSESVFAARRPGSFSSEKEVLC